jgi:hypothetical protein
MTTLTETDIRDVRDNRFSGKTSRIERPTSDQPAYRYSSPDQLAKLQADWDTADGWRKEREARVADAERERQAKLAASAVAAQTRRDEQLLAQREKTLDMLKRRYLAVPGLSETDWQADKETVLRDYARSQAISGDLDNAALRTGAELRLPQYTYE